MTNQQGAPEALLLAEDLEHDPGINRPSVVAELRRLHAENVTLQQGYDAARMEIDGLRDRVQELGAMLRENRCKRIVELEAQLEAIGAGGVEPLRRRECLHQIAEPAPIARNAAERDALLQAAIDFIGTLTGMTPPPIEVAPPEVFAPFRSFVDRVQAITMKYSQAAPADPLDTPLPCDLTAGGVTIGKGCPLRTVQHRLQVQADANALLLLRTKAPAHPDDAAVDALAAAMKAKLAKQRARGYGGWDAATTTQQRLSDMLRAHVDKGDPVDVANFCAFLAARGEGIAQAAQAVTPSCYEARFKDRNGKWSPWVPLGGGLHSSEVEVRTLAAPAAVAPLGEYPHEQMDAMALARYKVVPSDASMFWRHMVVAGDGTRQLYVGREVECQNMARKFAGAFLDGAFAFHSIASAPATQAAPAAQGDTEDAARYRCIRRGQHWSVIDSIGNELRAEALDSAIDVARKEANDMMATGRGEIYEVVPLWTTPQPTQAQAVNQADRPFIVRLAEDFAEECVTAGYVTTKAASYGRLMYEALSTQAQAGAVPLTDEQIQEAILPINPHGMGYFLRIARAIERAHGIGIKGGLHGAE